MPIKWPASYNKATSRHKEWSVLKKKHADAIKRSKLNFDADLGTRIDAFENLIAKVAKADFGNTATLQDLEKVSSAGLSARTIAVSYKSKVAALADPAKKELTAFLSAIATDAELWADATFNEPGANSQFNKDDWVVASAVADHLKDLGPRLTGALDIFRSNSLFATNATLQNLHKHVAALRDAVVAAAPAAATVEKLFTNATTNTSYLGVLKNTAHQLVAGPLTAVYNQCNALAAFLASDPIAQMAFTNDNNIPARTADALITALKTEMKLLSQAEKNLKVA
jgi:hypothetical protein